MKKGIKIFLASALALGISLSAASCGNSKDYSSEIAALQQQIQALLEQSGSDSTDYAAEIAALQQKILELQKANQQLQNGLDSVSSENVSLKEQMEALLNNNQIPKYTLGDDVPCYIGEIKFFEMKDIRTSIATQGIFSDGATFFHLLPIKVISQNLSGLIYDYNTNQAWIYSSTADNPVGINFGWGEMPLEGQKLAFLFFYNIPFAAVSFEF